MSGERKVGFAEITWNVENFSLSTRTSAKYKLETKTLYLTSKMVTKWRFKFDFKLLDRIRYLILIIRMISPDNRPEVRVWTNWKIWIKWTDANNLEQEKFVDEFQSVFHPEQPYECKRIPISEMFFKGFYPFKKDVFTIRCLVLFNDKYDLMANKITSVPVGFLSLSHDLSSKMNCQESFDCRMKNKEMEIGAHKAILYYRNNILKNMIDNDCVDGIINLQDKGGTELASIVHYLYSGNLERFMYEPTFVKLELARYLEIKEIHNWFILDYYYVESEYQVTDFTLHWKITDFSTKTGAISRTFKHAGSEPLPFPVTLLVYPLGFETPEHVSFFVKEMDVPLPPLTYIQVSIGKEFLNWVHEEEIFRCVEPDFVFGSESFARKESIASCLVNDTLTLKFRLKAISEAKWVNRVNPMPNLLSPINVDTYKTLSVDMTRMLNDGKFSDILLNTKNCAWLVHKCVLSARIKTFTEKPDECYTIFNETQPDIFEKFIHYIYSGVLEHGDHTELMGLYVLGVRLSLATLGKMCCSGLQGKITDENVKDISKFAAENNLELLKKAVMKFMQKKKL